MTTVPISQTEVPEFCDLDERLGAVTAPYLTSHPNPWHAFAMLQCSLAYHAGAMFGLAIKANSKNLDEMPEALDAMRENFREGVKSVIIRGVVNDDD